MLETCRAWEAKEKEMSTIPDDVADQVPIL
jgi:hypothetical protein